MSEKSFEPRPALVSLSLLVGIGISLLLMLASARVLAIVSWVLVGGGLLGLVVVAGAVLYRLRAETDGGGGDEEDPPGDPVPSFPLSGLDAELFALLDEAANA
ncbi:MAG TPA: hypothetical protein VGO87_12125 [Acidimicrobiia bacterium]|jgi:hypothetical protein